LDKVNLFIQSDVYEAEPKNEKTKISSSPSQTNIGHVEQYVAGNAINITNITNILQKLEKEIENEPNLDPQEKEELQNMIQEESTGWNKVKDGFAKYGGKFTGHILRSFVGLPDD